MRAFDELQRSLPAALEANRPGSGVDHVLIALPSFSVGESLLSHYVDRIPALEHRYLLSVLVLHRIEDCHLAFVACRAPEPEVVDYYLGLLPEDRRADVRRRLRIVEVPDLTGRAVASKLLDRPELIAELRAWIGGRPALLEGWNVRDDEVELATRLGVPVNGTDPALWPLGFKSSGRRIFTEAGVPILVGCEDVRSVAGVVEAVAAIRAARPTVSGVVVKLDDSGAGDGNVVIDLRGPGAIGQALGALPDWYRRDLEGGAVVEELVDGTPLTSPSAQVDLLPDGRVQVMATHEQVLGGATGQVFMGCRFPAEPDYAPQLAAHARAVGEALARRGACGRAGVDFVAARRPGGAWAIYAIEINLRKGGTTHPYAVLRNLVPGAYDPAAGTWVSDRDGSPRAYRSTDNLVDDSWVGLPPRAVIEAVRADGLEFDLDRGEGVVLHMLAGLAIDGRLGLTAIGHDARRADELYDGAAAAIARAASSSP